MVAVMRLPVGPDPGILPGSGPFELYLASCCVPVRDVSLEVGFEALEGLPVLAAKELVLEVPENLLGGTVVDAVAFARHALDETVIGERTDVGLVLVLPSHIRVQDRLSSCGLGVHEHLEHLLLLGEVGAH